MLLCIVVATCYVASELLDFVHLLREGTTLDTTKLSNEPIIIDKLTRCNVGIHINHFEKCFRLKCFYLVIVMSNIFKSSCHIN